LNLDNITWECDYPHSDSTWPNSPEHLHRTLDSLSDDEIDGITHLNAMRHFQFDPFTTLGRENCTVGALRSAAQDWNVELLPPQNTASTAGRSHRAADLIELNRRRRITAPTK
jgi:hypothetical protein